MATNSRRISNNAGSANSFLNAVEKPNKGEAKAAKAVAASGKSEKLVSSVLAVVKQYLDDSDDYQKKLDSKSIDVTLGRIASLLDEVKDKFVKTELEAVKEEILEKISGSAMDTIFKNLLLSQISELFDQSATKEDIEELKAWLQQNLNKNEQQAQPSEPESGETAPEKPEENAEAEDNEEGDYKDSTPAKNFMTLQTVIDAQFDLLNKNLKNLPGQGGMFKKLFSAIGVGFTGIGYGIAKLTKGVVGVIGKTASIAKTIVTVPFKGILMGISGLAAGIKGIAGGVVGLGKKVGGALAKPFKAIGGFFGRLNPFQRSAQKRESLKEKLKEKMMNAMSKVLDKLFKLIEPFIKFAVKFMYMAIKTIVVPISLIVLKVLFIAGAIVALTVGIVLGILWLKKKLNGLWNSIVEILDKYIIQPFMKYIWDPFNKYFIIPISKVVKKIWNYISGIIDDFKNGKIGSAIWKIIKGGFILVLAKALWPITLALTFIKPFRDKVYEFIYKAKAWWNTNVWSVIEPFVTSLTNLKDRIVSAFKGWDSNKPFLDNLKMIGGILMDTITDWWDNSPFKSFYEVYLKPFVDSAADLFKRLTDLGGYLKNAILDWWNGDSSLGDTLKNIGSIIATAIYDWYKESPLKLVIDELRNTIKLHIVAPFRGLMRKLKSLAVKAADIEISLPYFNLHGSLRPGKWEFGFKKIKPLSFLTGSMSAEQIQQIKADADMSTSDLMNEEIAKVQKQIDDTMASPDKVKYGNIAAQQVMQAAQPIRSIDRMISDDAMNLDKVGEAISQDIAQKEDRQEQYNATQSDKSDKILARLDSLETNVDKKLDDPAVIPMYLPQYTQAPNSAMMRSR